MSCDLLPSEKPGKHYQGDVRDVLNEQWDLIAAHPPCDHLCVSGARWFPEKRADGRQQAAIEFFMLFANHPCHRIAIENPIGIMSSRWRKPDQIIQPWQFGHGETKATCLWLKGLPKLTPTNLVSGREPRVHRLPPAPTAGKNALEPSKASQTPWPFNGAAQPLFNPKISVGVIYANPRRLGGQRCFL